MCALLPSVQLVRWSPQRSQESTVKGRQTLQFRQSAGDAQVDQVFMVESVQEEAEAQLLRIRHRKKQENVGNIDKSHLMLCQFACFKKTNNKKKDVYKLKVPMCRIRNFQILASCSGSIKKDTVVKFATKHPPYPNESDPGTQR